jgi:hypothetical protein
VCGIFVFCCVFGWLFVVILRESLPESEWDDIWLLISAASGIRFGVGPR